MNCLDVNFLWNKVPISWQSKQTECKYNRVQRKSFLQLAIRASWSQDLLAATSFQLAPKIFWLAELISQFFCYSNSSKNSNCPLGKLKTEFTSPIAKSTSPRLSDTTSFACCTRKEYSCLVIFIFVGIIYDVIVEPPSVGSTTDEFGHSKPVSLQFFPLQYSIP